MMNHPPQTPSGSILYISHGGGPLPLLGDAAHQELVASLHNLAQLLPRPEAIIVISAHWEEARPTITAAAKPALIYDYFGFPAASYEIQYPAAGAPQLARNIFDCFSRAGIDALLDEQRGFDHGLFVPLKIMYPAADIPCVQISLVNSLSPAEHLQIGKALAGLDVENLLVLGSGFSFHNLPAFFSPPTAASQAMNAEFDAWLVETCGSAELSETERNSRLEHWEAAPSARYCHPREEHLLPLHVCCGLARSAAREVFGCNIMGKKASFFLW
jgi:aromatic ring-opening dioxygenase catalytic subunit (LigB family)